MKKYRMCLLILLSLQMLCTGAFAGEDPLDNMVLVEGGCFMMGNDFGQRYEKPSHKVCLDSFYIDKYEATQKEYVDLYKENPSRPKGDDIPVNAIDWKRAATYCKYKDKRLPTEAEWEFAARERGEVKATGMSSHTDLDGLAWFKMNSGNSLRPVGQKKPNALGIYDMLGNVWEWVSDFYASGYYQKSPENNPKGPNYSQDGHVIRGGAYNDGFKFVSATSRKVWGGDGLGQSSYTIGVRCARSAAVQ